jgi:hypothetical protein
MDRRAFLVAGGLASLEGFSLGSAVSSQAFADVKQATNNGNVRQPAGCSDCCGLNCGLGFWLPFLPTH